MILLVEDNDDDVFIFKRMLRHVPQPPRVQVAINGQEAVDYLNGNGKYADRTTYPLPVLIFLDLKLPLMHGFEVLRWIGGQPALNTIPVLILSSSPEQRDRETAKKLGAKEFLVKPPTTEILADMLQKYAASRMDEGNGNATYGPA